MAKKITNENASDERRIDKKNTTYVLDSALASNVNFQYDSPEDPSYAPRFMRVRVNNDLVITYSQNKGSDVYGKTITTTIKDFYHSLYAGKFTFNGSLDTKTDSDYGPTLRYGYTTKSIDNPAFEYVYGNSKKNTYTLSSASSAKSIVDPSGNDTYTVTKATSIADYAGNDKYELTGVEIGNTYKLTDYKGNDKYTLRTATLSMDKEAAGNDTYNLSSNSTLAITSESKGKDKYTIENSSLTVTDNAGNDKYTAGSTSVVTIVDYGKSKDTYNLADTKNVASKNGIVDDGGADKYTFNNVTASDSLPFTVYDYAGKDKYTISGKNSINITDGQAYNPCGNDTYSVKNAEGIVILTDMGGNNKFTVTDSKFEFANGSAGELVINSYGSGSDKKHNDTYTLKNVTGDKYTTDEQESYGIPDKRLQESIMIFDNGGSDKFNLTNVSYAHIVTDKKSDSDKFGSDKYNFASVTSSEVQSKGKTNDSYTFSATNATIIDTNGNDSYTLKKLDNSSVFINDKTGEKDKLTIKSEKFADNKVIAVASGYHKLLDDAHNTSTALFLYDTESKGWVGLNDYYSVSDGEINGEGNGFIETIKVGNKTIKASEATFYNDFNALNEKVQSWLSTSSYNSVAEVFAGNNQNDISYLVQQVFQSGNLT